MLSQSSCAPHPLPSPSTGFGLIFSRLELLPLLIDTQLARKLLASNSFLESHATLSYRSTHHRSPALSTSTMESFGLPSSHAQAVRMSAQQSPNSVHWASHQQLPVND